MTEVIQMRRQMDEACPTVICVIAGMKCRCNNGMSQEFISKSGVFIVSEQHCSWRLGHCDQAVYSRNCNALSKARCTISAAACASVKLEVFIKGECNVLMQPAAHALKH